MCRKKQELLTGNVAKELFLQYSAAKVGLIADYWRTLVNKRELSSKKNPPDGGFFLLG